MSQNEKSFNQHVIELVKQLNKLRDDVQWGKHNQDKANAVKMFWAKMNEIKQARINFQANYDFSMG
jgi:(p)ppGpp synthase/HD superfamily hydrolase